AISMCVIAFVQMMAAASERRVIFILADIDVAHDLLHGGLVDYRSYIDFRIGAVAYAQDFRALDEFIAERLVHFFVNDQTRRSGAALTGSPERAPDRAFYRIVDVGVVHDDD